MNFRFSFFTNKRLTTKKQTLNINGVYISPAEKARHAPLI